MVSKATTVEEYLQALPEDRKLAMTKLRQLALKHLPKGFQECMTYGMIGYVVPHSLYPKGYHVDPKSPLPFMAIASQKNFVALYHMGIYGDEKLLQWFRDAYAKSSAGKLDMGKSCIRFKKPETIPYALIAELCTKLSPKDWIAHYERNLSGTAAAKKKK